MVRRYHDAPDPDRWIPIAEAAQLARVSRWTIRRRLSRLNRQCGGRLLSRFGGRKLFVSAEALLRVLRSNEFDESHDLDLDQRLEIAERRILALRDGYRRLRSQISEICGR